MIKQSRITCKCKKKSKCVGERRHTEGIKSSALASSWKEHWGINNLPGLWFLINTCDESDLFIAGRRFFGGWGDRGSQTRSHLMLRHLCCQSRGSWCVVLHDSSCPAGSTWGPLLLFLIIIEIITSSCCYRHLPKYTGHFSFSSS